MSTSFALSAGLLGGGLPLKSCFRASSCNVSAYPKPRAKKSRNQRLVICSLVHRLEGTDVAYRNEERYQVNIKQHEQLYSQTLKKKKAMARPKELWLDDLSTLQDTVPAAHEVARPETKPRVILIAGPTAVGKTRLSIELAKELGGEIINADSVQVYQGLDIGAAKSTMDERQGVPHHLMDIVPPTVEYTYAHFVQNPRAAADDILARGRVPIVIGGTGMYMRTFMHNSASITSHPFPGEDLTGEGDADPERWDFDFQAYFLYQHRADLFPRLDLRCELQIPELLDIDVHA